MLPPMLPPRLPPTLDPRRSAETPLLPGSAGGLVLAADRVHEVCGPARRTLAAMTAGAGTAGPVVWIAPAWQPERLCPDGLSAFLDPGRLILATARQPVDLLWAAEEALRSGAVAAVVADLPEVPGLTAMRRLQLAAEAGAAARPQGAGSGLGLVLTPGTGGAAGAETRWSLAQAPGGGWRLSRLRARLHPPAVWTLGPGGRDLLRETAAEAVDG